MKKFFERIKKQMVPGRIHKMNTVLKRLQHPVNNQDGSIIFIALMIMVVMTVIVLMTSDMAVTENMIIRNQAIYKQNISMVEAALSETFQLFMGIPPENSYLSNVSHVGNSGTDYLPWIGWVKETWASTDWYKLNTSTPVLTITGPSPNSMAITTPKTLADRGEQGSGNLKAGFIGWEVVNLAGGGSESLVVGANRYVWRSGRIVSEYVSRTGTGANIKDHGCGMLRMEIGVKRRIQMD